MTHRVRLLPLVIGVSYGLTAHAQEGAPTATPAEACFSLENDAARLACYDAALGRSAADTRRADEETVAAKEAEAAARAKARADARAAAEAQDQDLALSERTRRRLGAWFRADDPGDADLIANAGRGSLLDSRWELAKDSKLGVFQLRGYKPLYLLPAFWTSRVNETPSSPNPDNTVTEPQALQDIEAKFQLSFKTKFAENVFGDNGDIWGAYTQSSRWQVYNGEESRPFRETNYEPEVMLVFRNNYRIAGWKGRMAGIGINHQSNGRGDPLLAQLEPRHRHYRPGSRELGLRGAALVPRPRRQRRRQPGHRGLHRPWRRHADLCERRPRLHRTGTALAAR